MMHKNDKKSFFCIIFVKTPHKMTPAHIDLVKIVILEKYSGIIHATEKTTAPKAVAFL